MKRILFAAVFAFITTIPLLAAQWGAETTLDWNSADNFCKKKGMKIPSKAEFLKNVGSGQNWNFQKNYWVAEKDGKNKAIVVRINAMSYSRSGVGTEPRTNKNLVRCFKP